VSQETQPSKRHMVVKARLLALIDQYGAWFLVVWLLFQILLVSGKWHPDMASLYMGARMYAEGQFALVYASPEHFFGGTPVEWSVQFAKLGYPDAEAYPYIYPPIWAVIFAPLAQGLTPRVFMSVLFVAQVLALFGCVRLSWRICGQFMGWPRWAAATTLVIQQSAAANFALHLNQPQITLTFLTLLALERLMANRQLAAGAALGLVAAVKITPILLVLVFIVGRKWRALAACLVTCGGIGLVSVLVAGPSLHAVFLEKLALASQAVVLAEPTLSLKSILHYTFIDSPKIYTFIGNFGYVAASLPWIDRAAQAALLCMVIAAIWFTRSLPNIERLPRLLVALILATAIAGPLGWTHYYLAPTIMLPMLLDRQFHPYGRIFFLPAAILISIPVLKITQAGPWTIVPIMLALTAYLVQFLLLILPQSKRHGV
jgi:alpha-1,2-mannosyltransferase